MLILVEMRVLFMNSIDKGAMTMPITGVWIGNRLVTSPIVPRLKDSNIATDKCTMDDAKEKISAGPLPLMTHLDV